MAFLVQRTNRTTGVVDFIFGPASGYVTWGLQSHKATRFETIEEAQTVADRLETGGEEEILAREEKPEDRKATLS